MRHMLISWAFDSHTTAHNYDRYRQLSSVCFCLTWCALGCRLSDVGSALSECSSLAELRVSHNALASLPQDLSRNPRLKIIEAGGNQIANFQQIQVSVPCNFGTFVSRLVSPKLYLCNVTICCIVSTP